MSALVTRRAVTRLPYCVTSFIIALLQCKSQSPAILHGQPMLSAPSDIPIYSADVLAAVLFASSCRAFVFFVRPPGPSPMATHGMLAL